MVIIPTTIATKDNLFLKTKSWIIDNPKAVICLVHGFGEHISRYEHVGQFFNENGYAVFGFDLRGHGESGGKRGHTPTYEAYLDDIQLFINAVKLQYKNTPMFLYGHSMGGNLVLNYLIKRTPSVFGIITTGPWIQLAFAPKPLMLTLGKMMRSILPAFSQPSGLVREHLSRDPSVVAANRNDKLINLQITASAGMGITDAATFLNTYEGSLPVPTLIMHGGDDLITSQPASEAFAKRIKGDVTYRKWEGMYHEIHNEFDKIAVLNYTLDWLNKKI